jgi:hypothetical protein
MLVYNKHLSFDMHGTNIKRNKNKRKKVHIIYVRKQFSRWNPTIFFPSVGKLKNPSVFKSNWKLKDAKWPQLWCVTNHSQPLRDLLKRARVHDQTCPHVYNGSGGEHSEYLLCYIIMDIESRAVEMGAMCCKCIVLALNKTLNSYGIYRWISSVNLTQTRPISWQIFI